MRYIIVVVLKGLLLWGGSGVACVGTTYGQLVLYGTVVDSNSGQPLGGAVVSVPALLLGANADETGRFELTLPAATPMPVEVEARYVGYQPERRVLSAGQLVLDFRLVEDGYTFREALVRAVRMSDYFAGGGATTLSSGDIAKNNLGVDLPILLDGLTSVVTTSDAGTGIGYTSLRIRGSDASRINVTLNGVPYNDPESHATYWVNLPDLASSADEITVQNGVGSSTNGAAAFGANIAIDLHSHAESAYASTSHSMGSFGTRRHNVKFGTGLIQGFSLDGRLSSIRSEGYIDRAFSDLRSYYLSGAVVRPRTEVRLTTFSGQEQTYQAWAGVPAQLVDTLPTFNPYTYDNETDNYTQTHYQLFVHHKFNARLHASVAGFYTRGRGYYEQYRADDRLSNYGLDPIWLEGSVDTIFRSDLIRRRWLDNHFYGSVFSLYWQPTEAAQITASGGYNRYLGGHFGEVIWARFASNSSIRQRYYDNDAVKTDANAFVKWEQTIVPGRLRTLLDLQIRYIDYRFEGINDDLRPLRQRVAFPFFNPKAGVFYQATAQQHYYLTAAVARREPTRADFTDNPPSQQPRPEHLYDVELGTSYQSTRWVGQLNLYAMLYQDQLVVTGRLNDVGLPMRVNVPNSYRLGAEWKHRWSIHRHVLWSGNAAFGWHRLVAFTEYLDNWDTGEQEKTVYRNTPIAFSPTWIAGSDLTYQVWPTSDGPQQLSVSLLSKYVSRQYIDNTGSRSRSLDPYLLHDLRVIYSARRVGGWVRQVDATLMVRNLTNLRYSNNAWTYRFRSEGYDPRPDDPYVLQDGANGLYQMLGLFPQAGVHYLLGLTVHF